MAVLRYNADTRSVSLVKKAILPIPKTPQLGRAMSDLYDKIEDFIAPLHCTLY